MLASLPASEILSHNGLPALERSREVALDYACRAQASLTDEARRPELEALAEAVVDRNR